MKLSFSESNLSTLYEITLSTPPQTNMEPQNWWFGSMFLLFQGGSNSGSMLNFWGVIYEGNNTTIYQEAKWYNNTCEGLGEGLFIHSYVVNYESYSREFCIVIS